MKQRPSHQFRTVCNLGNGFLSVQTWAVIGDVKCTQLADIRDMQDIGQAVLLASAVLMTFYSDMLMIGLMVIRPAVCLGTQLIKHMPQVCDCILEGAHNLARLERSNGNFRSSARLDFQQREQVTR
mmetsp:Transcript_25677/g.59906  ORF Transcript_25677/g.59906 Transcript_25677/m.59906 type:complete len:126 (-) Transcript_25677:1043-1420(-)